MRIHFFIVLSCWFAFASQGSLALSSQFSQGNQKLDSLAKVYNNTGVDFAMEGDFEKASEYFLKSLRLRESIPNFPQARLAIGYLNLANLMLDLSYVDSALVHYSKSESILTELQDPPANTLGILYIQKGNCLRYRQDYTNAISYIKRGITLLSEDTLANSNSLILGYHKLYNAYNQAGNDNLAIQAAQKAASLSKRYNYNHWGHVNISLGLIHFKNEDFSNAIEFFKLSEESVKLKNTWRNPDIMALYGNLGFSYWKLGQNEVANDKFLKGISLINEQSIFSPQLGMFLRNYALYSFDVGEIDRAEKYLKLSISLNSREIDQSSSKNAVNFYSPLIATQCYEGLGDVYLKKFQSSKDSTYTHKLFDAYFTAITLMDGIRSGIQEDSDKLSLNENYHTAYLKALQASLLLVNTIPNASDYAFGISSKAKASVLNQALLRERGLEFSGVPKDLLKKEREMRINVSSLQERFYEEKMKGQPNSKQLLSIEERLFNAQREYSKLVESIENTYPKYFALKYDTTSVSVIDIQQKLSKSQVLIDYVITDTALVSFAVTEDKFQWKSQKIDSAFHDQLNVFLTELKPISFESLNRDNLQRFANSSYFLYQMLLEPFKSLIEGKEIIVVPHLQLSSIPFCALITEKTKNPRGYYDLPYLVKSNPIIYYPSTKLYYSSPEGKRSLFSNAVSFAPEYRDIAIDSSFITLTYRQNLSDLPGAENEAKAIADVFNGSLALNNDASEKRFKEYAATHNLIHLAMHTYIDEQNPLFSKLIFSNPIDSTEDGYLNMYEVYGLNINAKLTIISACRSGDGNLIKGEGLLSLARGFQYAGCPSLVAAQWRIDDFSGSEVMINFAKNLKRGRSKGVSLQKAQAQYIGNSDPLRSHPYFWASYQVIGDEGPMFISPFIKILILILITLLVSMLVWFAYKHNKSRSLKRFQD